MHMCRIVSVQNIPIKRSPVQNVPHNHIKVQKDSPIQNSPKNIPKNSQKNSLIDRSDNCSPIY